MAAPFDRQFLYRRPRNSERRPARRRSSGLSLSYFHSWQLEMAAQNVPLSVTRHLLESVRNTCSWLSMASSRPPRTGTTPPSSSPSLELLPGGKPPRTVTVPEEEAPASAMDRLDPITAIREHGGTTDTSLLIRKTKFTLGSSESCDVVVASSYVSSLHALMDRRGQRIRVHDQDSRNGTFFAGRRETTFDIGPGDVFTVATTPLLTLNEDMRLQRPTIAQIVGLDRNDAVDDVLIAAVRGGPLVLVGEAGMELTRLAQAIHVASPRCHQPLAPISALPPDLAGQRRLVAQAQRGTLVLEVADQPADEGFLSMALSASPSPRLLVIGPKLEAIFGRAGLATASRFGPIELRPLRDRKGDLPALLDRLFIDELASLRLTDLSQGNQDALLRYDWPGNLKELREAAARIAALVRHRNVSHAATALGISRTSLRDWIHRRGLTMPIVG